MKFLLLVYRNDSESETSPGNSRAPSRVDSAAERFNRRMSYKPTTTRLRKQSISKSAQKQFGSQNLKNESDTQKNMSAMSKRSVKNFDDKKYRSNSHLTPVDW